MEKKFDISKIFKEGEKIVISGIGGRFPESDTVDEFANNLYNNVDMIVDDDRRWPTGQRIKFNLTFKLKSNTETMNFELKQKNYEIMISSKIL
jgi:cell shape-determining protein MreC